MAKIGDSRLRLFPRDDSAFRDSVSALVDRLGGMVACEPNALERLLRETFPAARVQVQDRLGMNGNPDPYWYVFRDGRLRSASEPETTVATVTADTAGKVTVVDPWICGLLGRASGDLRGMDWRSLLEPDRRVVAQKAGEPRIVRGYLRDRRGRRLRVMLHVLADDEGRITIRIPREIDED